MPILTISWRCQLLRIIQIITVKSTIELIGFGNSKLSKIQVLNSLGVGGAALINHLKYIAYDH